MKYLLSILFIIGFSSCGGATGGNPTDGALTGRKELNTLIDFTPFSEPKTKYIGLCPEKLHLVHKSRTKFIEVNLGNGGKSGRSSDSAFGEPLLPSALPNTTVGPKLFLLEQEGATLGQYQIDAPDGYEISFIRLFASFVGNASCGGVSASVNNQFGTFELKKVDLKLTFKGTYIFSNSNRSIAIHFNTEQLAFNASKIEGSYGIKDLLESGVSPFTIESR